MLSLMQDNYTTVSVTINPKSQPTVGFNERPLNRAEASVKSYIFKVHKESPVVAGDYVVVNTSNGMKVGCVDERHADPKIDFD